MRTRYIFDAKGNLVKAGENYRPDPRKTSFQVLPDIAPYRSMIDGSIINSRSRHREQLRDNDCFEIGNDSSLTRKPRPLVSPPGLKEAIIRSANLHLKRK